MGKINEKDLLDEIRFDIKKKDLIKAKLVLASLDKVGRETQKLALFELSRADDDFAIPLLAGVIAANNNIFDSFPQLKEIMISKILDSPKVLMDMLSETKEPKIRGFLAEVAGEIRLKKAAPILLGILGEEKELKSILSVITALGMLGEPSAVSAISEHLYSDNKELVIAAARALGEIAVPDAVRRLANRLRGEKDLDLMILDIISKIQISEALEKLNELLGSEFVHLRTAAKKKLGGIGSMSIRVLIKNLNRNDSDLVIHSLNVLGDLGDSAAIPHIRKLIFSGPKDPNVRFAAYEALGRLPLDKEAFTLASGLEDPVDNVRNAAAKAIDGNYNPVLSGGVRNLLRSGKAEAIKIIIAIIESECEKIFLDLIEEDFFQVPSIKYLRVKAHPDVKSRFSEILSVAGYNDIAEQIVPGDIKVSRGKFKVFAVDDSKMILNIYRTVLHNLGCESRLFEFPASALDTIKKEKPDVILTDLNMPDITGIDLTRNIRKRYSKERLPIIMVTTQDETKDNESAIAAGINGILRKPFSEGEIGEALKRFAGLRLS